MNGQGAHKGLLSDPICCSPWIEFLLGASEMHREETSQRSHPPQSQPSRRGDEIDTPSPLSGQCGESGSARANLEGMGMRALIGPVVAPAVEEGRLTALACSSHHAGNSRQLGRLEAGSNELGHPHHPTLGETACVGDQANSSPTANGSHFHNRQCCCLFFFFSPELKLGIVSRSPEACASFPPQACLS